MLVGRAAHLAALESCLDRANAGHGRIVLISGEAGMGKTRMVAELEMCANARNMRVLKGACYETDRGIPLASFADLLRNLVSVDPGALEKFGPELAGLLPELTSLSPVAPPLEGEAGRHRLFHAVGNLFTSLAADRPLVLIVEDAHWTDDASADLVRHFASGIGGLPIMLLLTYRADEQQSALRRLLIGLDRQRLGAEIALQPLASGEVEMMLRALLGPDVPAQAEFVDLITNLSDGNPFFVEEMLRSLIASGELSIEGGRWRRKPLPELHVPRSVHEAVSQRAARLSSQALETLHLAAVLGRRFGFGTLQVLLETHEVDLLERLKELVRTELIVEASDELFVFRHALTREAVYGTLLARERRALHRRIAETIEALHSADPDVLDDHLDLAFHWYAGGVWSKALDYGVRAGERALSVYAPRVAIDQFTRAFEAADHLSIDAPTDSVRQRGAAYALLGEFDLAHADLEAAVQSGLAHDEPWVAWQALLDLGQLWMGRDATRARAYLNQALDRARQMDDRARIAHSRNRLGTWHLHVEDVDAALGCHQEALALFQALGDTHGLAETLDLLGRASSEAVRPSEAAAFFDQAIPLLRELDDRQGLIGALVSRSVCAGTYALDLASPEPAPGDVGETAVLMAREIGWRAGESFASAQLALVHGARAEYDRALRLANVAVSVAAPIGDTVVNVAAQSALAWLYFDLLDLDRARTHVEAALEAARSLAARGVARMASGLVASIAVAQRDFNRATQVLSEPERSAAGETLGRRLCRLAEAELRLARRDPRTALDLLLALDSSARVLLLRGEAFTALGRVVEAEAALHAALASARSSGARWLVWRIAIALGRLYADQRSSSRADQSFALARTEIHALAATIPDAPARDTFVTTALRTFPTARSTGDRQRVKAQFSGLTAREREVAALVAQGLSNRAIADQLVVGERTIETYVSSILNKLTYTSRAQIAAWAVDKGLARPR